MDMNRELHREKGVCGPDEQLHSVAQTVNRVDIPVAYGCNRRCWYCPVSGERKLQTVQYMEDDVFAAIMDQLANLEYSQVVTFHFYNEPLLRKDLKRLVAWARHKLPHATLVLYTNGDMLFRQPERYDELTEAGIDRWVITRHDRSNLDFFETVFARKDSVKVWEFERDFQIAVKGTGVVEESLWGTPCWDPAETLVFTPKGRLLPCCNDPYEVERTGQKITETCLLSLWEELTAFREDLINGNRRSICLRCDNVISCKPGSAARHAAIFRGQPLAGDESLTPKEFVVQIQRELDKFEAAGTG